MLEDFKVKLDMGKIILICAEEVELNTYKCEIIPKFLILKNEPNKIYGLDQNDFTEGYKSIIYKKIIEKGYEPIDIRRNIKEKIQTILQKEINKYINENINDVNYITRYSKIERSNYTSISFDFLRESHKFGEDIRNDRNAIKMKGISIRRINEGIIKIESEKYDNNSFEYDLEKQEFNITDEEIMKKFYKESELKLILAYEQYKKKKAPPLYNEIAKINEFLKDKKTVTLELYNGTKIKADARLNSIIDIREDGNIFIADRYSNKVIEGNPIEICECLGTELKCLKYGKNILNIQSEALKSLKIEESKEIQEEINEEIL